VSREFGIRNLVAESTEIARNVDAQKKVGEALPATVEEGCLIDDIRSFPQSRDRAVVQLSKSSQARCGRLSAIGANNYDCASFRSKLAQVSRFVLEPSSTENGEFRIVSLGTYSLPAHREHFQCEQVIASEEAGQIAWAEYGHAVDNAHDPTLRLLLRRGAHREAAQRRVRT
jgi:hypothetical protein